MSYRFIVILLSLFIITTVVGGVVYFGRTGTPLPTVGPSDRPIGGGDGGGFACGPDLVCDPTTQYCSAFFGGPAGVPPNYRCADLPDGCPSPPTCECISTGIGYKCTESGGGITVTSTAP